MFALVYASEAVHPFSETDLAALAEQAAARNARLGVTGYLHYRADRRTIFQYLEGERETVLALMDEIAADRRHRVLNRLDLGERGLRLFPAWSMRFLRAGDVRAIRIEDVFESVLVTMRAPAFRPEASRPIVLRLVRRLALRQIA